MIFTLLLLALNFAAYAQAIYPNHDNRIVSHLAINDNAFRNVNSSFMLSNTNTINVLHRFSTQNSLTTISKKSIKTDHAMWLSTLKPILILNKQLDTQLNMQLNTRLDDKHLALIATNKLTTNTLANTTNLQLLQHTPAPAVELNKINKNILFLVISLFIIVLGCLISAYFYVLKQKNQQAFNKKMLHELVYEPVSIKSQNHNQSGFYNQFNLIHDEIKGSINVGSDGVGGDEKPSDSPNIKDYLTSNKKLPNNKFHIALDSTRPDLHNETKQQISVDDHVNHAVLDHADIFLSIGRNQLAIQLLQNHLCDFPKQSITIWLFLLDLLAKDNLQTLYESTAQDCKKYFNVKIPHFSNEQSSTNNGLESFVRLTNGLTQVWGSVASLKFLDDLIYNTRLEARIGFEKNVMQELVLLRGIAQEAVKTANIINFKEKKMLIQNNLMQTIKDNQATAIKLKKKSLKLKKTSKKLTIQAKDANLTDKNTPFEFERTQQMFAFNITEF